MENMNGYKMTADAYRVFKKKDPEADVDGNISQRVATVKTRNG